MTNLNIINNSGLPEVESFIRNVIDESVNKIKFASCENIEVTDYDGDRFYLTIDNKEFTIRTWDIIQRKKTTRVKWSLYEIINKEDGSSYGVEISYGTSNMK